MYQVLIVDDEPIVKIALRSMLDWSTLGFHICATASNGQEALEMAEKYRPDLIICDLKMPVMDGIELIRTAKDRKMDCEFLVISNYEDFNYVRTALVLGASDYILKVSISPEELTSQLQKIREKLELKKKAQQQTQADTIEESLIHQGRHAAWREFFTHKSYPLSDLLSITGTDTSSLGSLALCEISFDWYDQQMETLPSTELIRSTLKNALEHFNRRRIIFFSSSNTLIVIPEEELNAHQNTIAGLAARIEQLFRYYMPLSPAILYQDGIANLEEARKIYHRFQDLLELNFYHTFGLTDAAGLDTTSTIPAISYKDLAADILALPKETCLDSALERVSEILNACSQKNVLPSRVIQYFVRFLDELGYHISGVSIASHDQIVERIECIRNAVSQEELSLHLEQALTTFFRPTDTSAAQTEQYSSEVLQAISYIRENYSRKISLASVAEHVGLSSGYLCRIFKEETGVSINAYINNLRMTHAGELLADKNSYIKEVAISVGFEDQLYFSRLFKRYYGVTPSEYRAGGASSV